MSRSKSQSLEHRQHITTNLIVPSDKDIVCTNSLAVLNGKKELELVCFNPMKVQPLALVLHDNSLQTLDQVEFEQKLLLSINNDKDYVKDMSSLS